MTTVNGYANGSADAHNQSAEQPAVVLWRTPVAEPRFGADKLPILFAELEVPFEPAVIEWRVVNTARDKKRGQIIPYADQRAYTDRLNSLFTPAGWTRKYAVHTGPNSERNKDQKSVAKVFVTCEMTIFGIGSHSATGEEWADDENAGTSAEAQSFKRACACFGLGRYLYYFTGIWVDLDENRRLITKPTLHGWATPQGWREGLRPGGNGSSGQPERSSSKIDRVPVRDSVHGGEGPDPLIHEIERMEGPLGSYLWRGLLRLAKAWKPSQIQDVELRRKTLERMRAAERGLCRLRGAVERLPKEQVAGVLKSLKIRSTDRVDNLEHLHRLVSELELIAFPKR